MSSTTPEPRSALQAWVTEAESEAVILRNRVLALASRHRAADDYARMVRNLVALMPYAMPRIPAHVLAARMPIPAIPTQRRASTG